ncbi:MAG: MBL fold metallo-hydrolase, partial [Syntrophales bacterium]|nr:MBL fold metallo-hydrolase [Syntrophales bacterium]
ENMEVHFWGSRGSLPAPLTHDQIRTKITHAVRAASGLPLRTEEAVEAFTASLPFSVRGGYGGNTSCMEIRGGGEEYVLCDAGTGLRDFGRTVTGKTTAVYNILLSHLHWDHIQGFPFFTPAYVPGNVIHIFGLHPRQQESFVTQQRAPFFPVPLQATVAHMDFTVLETGVAYNLGGHGVQCIKQVHPGDSFGYAFSAHGKKIVYSTDSEHHGDIKETNPAFIDFIRGADLLIYDAQYNFLEASETKKNWGHSNNILAVEIAVTGEVKRLCLFHHEHTYGDDELDRLAAETEAYLKSYAPASTLEIFMAYDGLTIAV